MVPRLVDVLMFKFILLFLNCNNNTMGDEKTRPINSYFSSNFQRELLPTPWLLLKWPLATKTVMVLLSQ